MAVATKADIEKVVRRVLQERAGDERAGGTNGATLEAIRRVSRLLTEQVIPKLTVEAETDGEDAEGVDDEGVDDETEFAESDEPLTAEVPGAVTQAFEEAYRTLSADQAQALASLFTAIAHETVDGDEQGESGEEGEDDENGAVARPARDHHVTRGPSRRLHRG